MRSSAPFFAAISVLTTLANTGLAGERDVQIVNVFPEAQTLMLFNSGDAAVDLSGWRFCSHNTTMVRQYTSPSGLDGVVVEPSNSIFIQLLNDANPQIPNQFNASDLGGNFADFELAAYGLSIYFPNDMGNVVFGDGNLIADHIQWSLGGIDNATADERSDEAVKGGVWTDEEAWINVRNDTLLIELIDPDFAELHGPDDYNILIACRADLTDDGLLNFFDISAFLSAFSSMDPAADFTGDGLFNFFDVSQFLSSFQNGC